MNKILEEEKDDGEGEFDFFYESANLKECHNNKLAKPKEQKSLPK